MWTRKEGDESGRTFIPFVPVEAEEETAKETPTTDATYDCVGLGGELFDDLIDDGRGAVP